MTRSIMLAISVAVILSILANVSAASDEVEVRGQVTNLGVPEFTWNALNFPGFFYEADENIGTEQITFLLTDIQYSTAILNGDSDASGNYGITYTTTAQSTNFKFKPWGRYNAIGFLGEKCFVSYNSDAVENSKDDQESQPYLFENSQDKGLLENLQLSRVLIDLNAERIIASNKPLMLEQGYELHIKNVDASSDVATLELTKDSQIMDTGIVAPSRLHATLSDKTYCYKADLGNAKGIVQIAVHFKNAFNSSEGGIAAVDAIFQVSDEPISVMPDEIFDVMQVANVDTTTNTITLDNKDYRIFLKKNMDMPLMQNIHIKTANQEDANETNPLRYYIYTDISGNKENMSAEVSSAGRANYEASADQEPSSKSVREGL